VKCEGSTNIT